MTRKKATAGLAILVAVVGAVLAYTGWEMVTPGASQACDVCGRPLHALSRTVGLVGGEEEDVFCCPACALTAHRQTGREVKIIQLTDYETDKPLAPRDAYIVEGSEVNLCIQHQMLMDQEKQTSPMAFDRCSPSMIAFGSKEAAERFSREHGGAVWPFADLARAYEQ